MPSRSAFLPQRGARTLRLADRQVGFLLGSLVGTLSPRRLLIVATCLLCDSEVLSRLRPGRGTGQPSS